MHAKTLDRLTKKEGAIIAALDEFGLIKQSNKIHPSFIQAAIIQLHDYRISGTTNRMCSEIVIDSFVETAILLLNMCNRTDTPPHSIVVIEYCLCRALELIQILINTAA